MSPESSTFDIRVAIITIADRLDALRAAQLRAELDEAIEAGTVRFIVDLSEAKFVDSAGLAALAKGMKDCRERNGDLRVVAATYPDAARVFALTRFDQVFTMGTSVEELVESW